MIRRRRLTAALVVALALSACLNGIAPPEPPVATDPADVAYAATLGVNLAAMMRSPTGLYLQDVVPGSGPAATNSDSVRIRYRGYLTSGQLFAASPSSGPVPFRLPAVSGELIRGLVEGITGMRPGGTRKLVIPPGLGFGFNERPGAVTVPGNSVLVFDVELVSIE
jgi:FKBP-type peptidyl-prolyl cis-trans isomerase